MKPMARVAAALGVALLSACATLEEPFRGHLEAESAAVRECAQWYRALDASVAEAGVRDAQDARVEGFPYLRVNRLLAAFRAQAASGDAVLHALAERMLALDLAARRFEMMNLPAERLAALELTRDRFGLRLALQRTAQCGRLLREIDLAKPQATAALLARAEVPDDYSVAARIFGLYAITRIAFMDGVRRQQEETLAAFRRELATAEGASLVRFAPPPVRPPARGRVAAILRDSAANALGVPEPGESELLELLAAHAPSFELEITGDHDRFGALRWSREARTPVVDASEPVVYGNVGWERLGDRVLLQLVYTIWFPERPPLADGDIFAGQLDGLSWRVTLAPDGEPIMYDSIHPCGCDHLFFPTPRAEPLPAPAQEQEWMFSPQSLPRIAEDERVLLRVATRTHFIERVSVVRGVASLARYEIRPYDELRSVARPDGTRASVFGEDGLIAGTERPERLLFWPMGIRSAGAMRQWGRHATAFVGRRHFDDADLLGKRFRLDLR